MAGRGGATGVLQEWAGLCFEIFPRELQRQAKTAVKNNYPTPRERGACWLVILAL